MLKKLIFIIAVLGLLLTVPGGGNAQAPAKLKITVDILTVAPMSVEIDFVVGPVPCPQEIKNWSTLACTAWDWLKLQIIENPPGTLKIKVEEPIAAEWTIADLPQTLEYAPVPPTVLVKITIELVGGGAAIFTLQNPLQAASFQELVENIINFVWVISLVVTPLMILIAGFLFLTAGGRPNQITAARKMIFWTILGFVIITLAEGIIAMLKGILGG